MKQICIRTGLVLLLLVAYLLLFLYGCAFVVYHSEHEKTKDLVTLSLLETSAAYFIPSLFLSDSQINAVIEANKVTLSTDTTDPTLVSIDLEHASQEVQLVEVSGSTYVGRLLIVPDPSRVYLATPTWGFATKSGGMTVAEMVERDGALAGINAGGFKDSKGTGDGGTPTGYVIQNGELTYGSLDTVDCVTGFDENHTLIVGRISAQEALDAGIVNGFCFNLSDVGPLIIDGEPVQISGTGSGLNPRTAIGQTADGTLLLLSIDGRQAHSLGAGYQDLIDIFLAYGAGNASNLDGGSSAMMIYQGEAVSVSSSLYGDRSLPTAILVK